MDTPVTPSIGLFHADKQTVEALGPVVQLAKSGFFYCTQGEMSLVLGNRAFEIHRGDIYIYPPLSKTYIRMLSDDLHGTVGVADFDFVFTLANSISNTQNHLYMRENPCISLNDEQRRRIEELIELIRRRERSQGSRSTNENNRLIYKQLLSSLGKALCCEIAEAYFFNHPIQPLKQDRKDRIFQSFIFSLSQNFRTHHSVSFYAAEQCLTPRYFSTIVREKSGRNALQWIMMFIIAEAKKLLSIPIRASRRSPKRWDSPTSPSSAAISSNTSVSRRWHSAPPARRSNARTKQGAERTSFCPLYFGPPRTVVRPSRQRIIHASSSRR